MTDKSRPPFLAAKVKWWNESRSFGFLETADGFDVFVDGAVVAAAGLGRLAEGRRVIVELDADRVQLGPIAKSVRAA